MTEVVFDIDSSTGSRALIVNENEINSYSDIMNLFDGISYDKVNFLLLKVYYINFT
jgi:hypothetical protein